MINVSRCTLLITYLLSLVLCHSVCSAAAETYNLDQCIKRALSENPQMKIAAERLKSAKARKKETAASYGPVLSGSMSWLKRNESEGSAGIASLSPTFRYFIADELYDAKLSLSQPLFMWGKIKEANRQASFGYNMAQEDMETAKKDTLFKVQEAFYRVILGRQLVRIARGSRDIADRQLKVVESFYNEGKSSSYDVGRVKVALANVKTNLIRAENGYELALQALENLLDMKSGEADFEGEMTDPGLEFKLDTLVDESIRNRPEIRRIVLAEKSAASLVRMTAAGNRPNLLAAGASEWQNTGFSTNDPYHTWSAMLVLNVPIFDGWSTRQRTKQARSNLEEVRHTRSSLEEVIKLEVTSAYFSYKQAREALEANRENVALARSNFETAEKRYQLGLMSDLELRDAQLALTQAETNLVQALFDCNVALASIEKAAGR